MSPPRSLTRYRRIALAVGLATSLVACVLPDQVSRIEKQVADLQQEVRDLSGEQQRSRERLESLAQRLEEAPEPREGISRTEFADVGLSLDEIRRRQIALDQRVADSQRRMDRISESVEANREILRRVASGQDIATLEDAGDRGRESSETDGDDAERPATALPSPEDLYNAAYADFSKGNFELAVSGFEEYATRYPRSDLADNALYWIGECHFSQGDYSSAIRAFDRMLERYPDSDRSPAANLKKGLAFLEQNQIRQAIVQLHYVEDAYPGSDESRIARDKLASLGALSR